jgi:hypothetical protein
MNLQPSKNVGKSFTNLFDALISASNAPDKIKERIRGADQSVTSPCVCMQLLHLKLAEFDSIEEFVEATRCFVDSLALRKMTAEEILFVQNNLTWPANDYNDHFTSMDDLQCIMYASIVFGLGTRKLFLPPGETVNLDAYIQMWKTLELPRPPASTTACMVFEYARLFLVNMMVAWCLWEQETNPTRENTSTNDFSFVRNDIIEQFAMVDRLLQTSPETIDRLVRKIVSPQKITIDTTHVLLDILSGDGKLYDNLLASNEYVIQQSGEQVEGLAVSNIVLDLHKAKTRLEALLSRVDRQDPHKLKDESVESMVEIEKM